jgi:hypothetical protein
MTNDDIFFLNQILIKDYHVGRQPNKKNNKVKYFIIKQFKTQTMLWYIKMKEDNHGLNCKTKTKTKKRIKKVIERTVTKTG